MSLQKSKKKNGCWYIYVNKFKIFLFVTVTDDGKKVSPDQRSMSLVQDWMRKKARGAFTKKMLYRRLPILKWLPQ